MRIVLSPVPSVASVAMLLGCGTSGPGNAPTASRDASDDVVATESGATPVPDAQCSGDAQVPGQVPNDASEGGADSGDAAPDTGVASCVDAGAPGAGANTPFRTIEAETGTLGGGATLHGLPPGLRPTTDSPELEASGRQYVRLDQTGASVSLVNGTCIAANRLVVRASIPDAPSGGGIAATLNLYVNGALRQPVSLSSRQSWVYGYPGQGWNNNSPDAGPPNVFYNEQRVVVSGTPIQPGDTIKFQKDADNTAASYDVDLVDVEAAPPPLAQPPNTLSITSYGAVADDAGDDTTAIQNCINDAQSKKLGVWIPAGTFNTTRIINATGITISGAGMWYTTLYRNVPVPNSGIDHWWSLKDCTLQDVYFDTPATGRNRSLGDSGGLQVSGAGGWLIERVWFQHTDAAVWATGTNGTVRDCRTSDTWADGINLNNGQGPDGLGKNLAAQNNFVRASVDDGIAINSDGQNGGQVDTISVVHNTSTCTLGANNLRIASGINLTVQYNYLADPVDENGMVVGVFWAGTPLVSADVSHNVIERGSGFTTGQTGGMIIGHSSTPVTANVHDNTIVDSPGDGVDIGVFGVDVTFDNNMVVNPYDTGVLIEPKTTGSGVFQSNTVTGLRAGQIGFQNDATATFMTMLSGNSW
jgi:hypothetical protein